MYPAGISQAPVLGKFNWCITNPLSVPGIISCSEVGCGLRAELNLAAGDIVGTGESRGQSFKVPVVAHQRRLHLPSGDLLLESRAGVEHFQLPSVVCQALFIHDPWLFCLILILLLPSHLIFDKLAVLFLQLREVYQGRA